MLDSEGHIAVTDFGLCKEGFDEKAFSFCGKKCVVGSCVVIAEKKHFIKELLNTWLQKLSTEGVTTFLQIGGVLEFSCTRC